MNAAQYRSSRRQRLRRADAVTALARLAALAGAGLPTAEALTTAARTGGRAGRILDTLARSVQRGSSLSAAMNRLAPLFDATEVALVRAGEASGSVPRALSLLAARMEQRDAASRKIVSALAYPCFLIVFSMGVLAFIAVSVLPSFVSLYEGQGRALPASTTTLLAFGRLVTERGPAALALVLGAALLWLLAKRQSRRLRLLQHRALLVLPVIGAAIMSGEKARACSVIAALADAGLDMEQAVRLASATNRNLYVRRRLQAVAAALLRGTALSRAWRRSGLDADGADAGLLEVAESAGDYAAAFARLAAVASLREQETLSRIAGLAEPASVVFMAVVVSAGALALYQPVLGSASLVAAGF